MKQIGYHLRYAAVVTVKQRTQAERHWRPSLHIARQGIYQFQRSIRSIGQRCIQFAPKLLQLGCGLLYVHTPNYATVGLKC